MNRFHNKNTFNVNKLLLSKWTAKEVKYRQKHFLVTELIHDDTQQKVVACILEAVIDKQLYQIDWRELRNTDSWIQGWK